MLTRRMFDLPGNGWRNSFVEMERMRRDMARLSEALFGNLEQRTASSGVFPLLNITEDADNYYLRAELPGIEAQSLDLQVNGSNLSISGERRLVSEGGGATYHRRERKAGKFSRVVNLPGDIDADNISARMEHGALTVVVAKSATAKPRQISIN